MADTVAALLSHKDARIRRIVVGTTRRSSGSVVNVQCAEHLSAARALDLPARHEESILEYVATLTCDAPEAPARAVARLRDEIERMGAPLRDTPATRLGLLDALTASGRIPHNAGLKTMRTVFSEALAAPTFCRSGFAEALSWCEVAPRLVPTILRGDDPVAATRLRVGLGDLHRSSPIAFHRIAAKAHASVDDPWIDYVQAATSDQTILDSYFAFEPK
jgi:hypothetical protein